MAEPKDYIDLDNFPAQEYCTLYEAVRWVAFAEKPLGENMGSLLYKNFDLWNGVVSDDIEMLDEQFESACRTLLVALAQGMVKALGQNITRPMRGRLTNNPRSCNLVIPSELFYVSAQFNADDLSLNSVKKYIKIGPRYREKIRPSDWREEGQPNWYASRLETGHREFNSIKIKFDDLKTAFPEQSSENSQLEQRQQKSYTSQELHPKERKSLYKILYVIAKSKYGFDPDKRGSSVSNIKSALDKDDEISSSLEEDTIRKHLKNSAYSARED